MKKFKKFLTHLLVVLLAVQGAVAAQLYVLTPERAKAASTPEVVINEVMWMGSVINGVDKIADEWIELKNTIDVEQDISGWTLTNTGITEAKAIPASSKIPANGFFLISNYNKADSNTILDITPDYVTTSVSLSNSCQSIVLMKADATAVDQMGCNGNKYFYPADSSVKHSLERNVQIADGQFESSWHDSVGFANLISVAKGFDLATPGVANDTSIPDVTDAKVVVGPNINEARQFQYSETTIDGNWADFTDPESNIASYQVFCSIVAGDITQLCPGETDLIPVPGGQASYQITGLDLTIGPMYYFNVIAIDGVGLESAVVSSNSVSIDRTPPLQPSLTVGDTLNDNGGSVTADWTDSKVYYPVTYTISYWDVTDPSKITFLENLNGLTDAITGLNNKPVVYGFQVQAIDENGNPGPKSVVQETSAIDNLAATLDRSKVVVEQNKPGTEDAVKGLSGASNKADEIVTVYSDSSLTDQSILGSIQTKNDGSFSSILIGDNKYSEIWVQLANVSDPTKKSNVEQFSNDITGPKASVITDVNSSCDRDPCRVNITWTNDDPDATNYEVAYVANGVETKISNISNKSLLLDLETGKKYDFTVYAYDTAGNKSDSSNTVSIQLTKGVKTIVTWVNGAAVTTTEGLAAAAEVSQAPLPQTPSLLVPPVQAAEPNLIGSPTPTATSSPATAGESNKDWVRIFVVVVILLIIAGSFYALSRSISDEKDDETPPKKDKDAGKSGSAAAGATTTTRRRRRNRRR